MAAATRLVSDADLQAELQAAGSRLVLCAFTASWSAPCESIPALLGQLSAKFPRAVFLEVDVDQCQTLAATHGVSVSSASLPAFAFFRSRVCVETVAGGGGAAGDAAASLDDKLRQLLGAEAVEADPDIPRGYVELNAFVNKAGCECLNGSDEHGFENSLVKDDSFLESDCDEQLLISMAFNQPVKLYALRINGPNDGHGPRTVKVFINQTRSMDFEEAERCDATQTLVLSSDELSDESSLQLRYVKFQHVNNVTVFVKDNQGGEETTRISYLAFIGTTVQATNMSDFKRIAGKKGESH